MAKLTEYAEKTKLNKADIFITDGADGTKKIKAENTLYAINNANGGGWVNKRTFYRGKNLGSSFTAAQKAAIQNGSFDDLCIGDYWTISGKTYRIADINYYYGTGYNPNDTGGAPLNTHHLVIQCDTMEVCGMNPTDTTAGGFLGSNMYTAKFPTYRTIIKAAFGDSVLKHWVLQTNEVTDGHPSGILWTETDIDLMTEEQVYGTSVMRPRSPGTSIYRGERIGCQQLALYALKKNYGYGFWLKDVVGASHFAGASGSGSAYYWGASNSDNDVRPIFCIG